MTKEEYQQLPLNKALEYTVISKCKCSTPGCEKEGEERVVDASKPPHDFIYADERMSDGALVQRFTAVKNVCTTCMVVMDVLEEEYVHTDTDKYRFSAKKAKGDRGKNYYRDFTKTSSNTQAEPGVGLDAQELTQKDISNFERNMKGKI
jgi:hypothetical protein